MNERLSWIGGRWFGKPSVIIIVYAPTLASSWEEIAETVALYESLDTVIKLLPAKYGGRFLMLGDFNARVGNDTITWKGIRGGTIQSDEINVNGERLLDLCSHYRCKIANSFFVSKEGSWTWKSSLTRFKPLATLDFVI